MSGIIQIDTIIHLNYNNFGDISQLNPCGIVLNKSELLHYFDSVAIMGNYNRVVNHSIQIKVQ